MVLEFFIREFSRYYLSNILRLIIVIFTLIFNFFSISVIYFIITIYIFICFILMVNIFKCNNFKFYGNSSIYTNKYLTGIYLYLYYLSKYKFFNNMELFINYIYFRFKFYFINNLFLFNYLFNKNNL